LSRSPIVFIVSAPSGTGKTAALERLLAETAGLRFSVSHTTRAPRKGETDGVQYHFVTHERFDELVRAGGFLEWAEVHGERYGTTRDECERAQREDLDLLLDVDVQGAALVRQAAPGCVSVFLLPPSRAVLEARLRGRGADPEAAIHRRLDGARREVARWPEYDYIIVNRDLGECVESLKAIVGAARCRRERREAAAREVAATFEFELERETK